MCTAISYKTKDHYFGRNLDIEMSYHEEIVITPRNYPLPFRQKETLTEHYAMIGMATVVNGYPLYYEATNEQGLSMAGLNFPGNAHYYDLKDKSDNIAPFELIPWILCQCKTVSDVLKRAKTLNIAKIPFSPKYPLTPLHWLISDKDSSIVLESTKDGLQIYENPSGVLTNNPPFPYHMQNLEAYQHLTTGDAPGQDTAPELYSRGSGAVGLPGDYSSKSRFVKAVFVKANAVTSDNECDSIGQFFHILDAVSMPRGCVEVNGAYEITVYSCCCNTDKGIYYYTTYGNRQITAVNMHNTNLKSDRIAVFPLVKDQNIHQQN